MAVGWNAGLVVNVVPPPGRTARFIEKLLGGTYLIKVEAVCSFSQCGTDSLE